MGLTTRAIAAVDPFILVQLNAYEQHSMNV
jgi:hypothetical protein